MATDSPADALGFLEGGGKMGALMRAWDWSKSPLGQPSLWPDRLKSAVATCLSSQFPMVIWWGPDLIMLYNDAWQPILGETKHPAGLGRPGAESWPETWPIVGRQFQSALEGVGSWHEDQLLASDRHGFLEECYFTYSHSPLRDAQGTVVGVQSVVAETTARVIGERRLTTLQRLSGIAVASASEPKTLERSCQELIDVLCAGNPDLPFAVQYLLREDGRAHLVAAANVDPRVFPPSIASGEHDPWGLGRILAERRVSFACPPPGSDPLPGGAWPEPTTQVVAIPKQARGEDSGPLGLLVVGVNARLRLDLAYLDFLKLAAGQVSASISLLRAIGDEKRSAELKDALIGQLHERTAELKTSQDRTAADLQAITRLYEVGARCARAGDPFEHCLEEILDAAILITKADKGNLQLFDRTTSSLRIAVQRGFDQPFLDFFAEVRGDDSACAAAMRSTGRVLVEDISNSSVFAGRPSLDVLLAAGVQAVQSTPLVGSRGNLLGMISTHFEKPARPADRELRFLDLLARQAADLLERREVEGQKLMMARELDHRARNLLTVVQSILHLTQAEDSRSFVAAVTGRITALARAHASLSDSAWQGIELSRLVRDELSPYGIGTAAVSAGGPAVTLQPAAGQSVAMVLHELATNAAKHGALSQPGGRLEVSWNVGEDGSLGLIWAESGAPRIAGAPTRRGFGSMVIAGAIQQQLDGRMELDWRQDGLRAVLTVPGTHIAATEEATLPGLAEEAKPPANSTRLPQVQDRQVLLVEDDALVAMLAEQTLSEAGCAVVGPAATIEAALTLLESRVVDAALLDRDLGGSPSEPIARRLLERRIPFAFVTGYGDFALAPELAAVPRLQKPFDEADLIAMVSRLIAGSHGSRAA